MSFISFRDREACERVRAIPRSGLTNHPNPDFRIGVVDDSMANLRGGTESLEEIFVRVVGGGRSTENLEWL